MNSIPHPDKDVDKETTSKAENQQKNQCREASEKKSAFSPESLPSEAPKAGGQIHSFSRSLARDIQIKKGKNANHGAHEAMVLKYLANRSSTIRRPDGSFYTTLDELAEHFTCIGRTALWEIVTRLEKHGYLKIYRRRNRQFRDRTLWYSVSTKMRNKAEEDLLYFDSMLAGEVGIVAAVLHKNFEYWANQSMEQLGHGEVEMSPAKLARLLPFGKRTIARELEELTKTHLKKVSCGKAAVFAARESTENATVPNPDITMPNPDTMIPNPNKTVPNPDSITSLVTIINPLETPSKQKPPVSDFVMSDDRMQNNGINSCSTTSFDTQDPDTSSSASVSQHKDSNDSGICKQHNDLWELVTDAEFLHDYLVSQASWIGTMDEAGKASLCSIVDNLCIGFLSTLSITQILKWRQSETRDGVFADLAPLFREHLADHPNAASLGGQPVVCFGALECVLGALVYRICVNRHTGFYTHAVETLQRITYLLSTQVDEIARGAATAEDAGWLAERMENLGSVDRDKEDDASLVPATKARIFRNAVNARNEVGWIFWDQSHRQHQISMGKAGLKQVQKIFELNPDLFPAMLLKVLDKGMVEFSSRPMPKPHESSYRHFRRLNDICHFVNALKILVPHYGCSANFAGVTFLGEDASDFEEYEEAAA